MKREKVIKIGMWILCIFNLFIVFLIFSNMYKYQLLNSFYFAEITMVTILSLLFIWCVIRLGKAIKHSKKIMLYIILMVGITAALLNMAEDINDEVKVKMIYEDIQKSTVEANRIEKQEINNPAVLESIESVKKIESIVLLDENI